jgi:hypothetical protein
MARVPFSEKVMRLHPPEFADASNAEQIAGDVTCVREWIEVIAAFTGVKSPPRFYYRGEPGSYPCIEPTLARRDIYVPLSRVHKGTTSPYELQRSLLDRLRRYTTEYHYDSSIQIGRKNVFEWMCLAQHHGLPTLMVDWTLNPLVALYFAVEHKEIGRARQNGRVWIMELKPKEDRKSSTKYLGIDREKTDADDGDELIAKIPLLVVPRILTRRIETQAGRFVYADMALPVATSYPYGAQLPWKLPLKYYTVPESAKKHIKEELRTYRIHEGTMYADLDGYARYLKNGGL